MPHAVSSASAGLQAIILCGPGSSFPTFTNNYDENPKALLPIANRPMVWYPIDFCNRAGITDITLICPPSTKQAIQTALQTIPCLTSLAHPRPTLLAPEGLETGTGTAGILRLPEIRELITSDFVVLPCDLVCELGGDKLLQAWMVRSVPPPSSGGKETTQKGGLGVWYETKTAEPIKGEETDLIATASLPSSSIRTSKNEVLSHLSSLVYSIPSASLRDLVQEKKGFPIRHGLLRAHPKLKMLTTLRDAHIYVFPQWVIKFVEQNPSFDSAGEDVVGWWAKACWQKGLPEKLGLHEALRKETLPNETDSQEPHSPATNDDPNSSPIELLNPLPVTKPTDTKQEDFAPRFLAYLHPSKENAPLIRRVDTTPLLLSVSLQLAKLPSIEEVGPAAASPFAHAKKLAYPEGVKPRTTITQKDSLVGDNVMVEEKTSIKESVVGAHCQIREGAKLLQCVLMDGVVVGKHCKLTRCVLGKRCEIGDGSVLVDCEVQENLLVDGKSDEKGQNLMSDENLQATQQELDDLEDAVDEMAIED